VVNRVELFASASVFLAVAILSLAVQSRRRLRRGVIQLDHLVLTVRSLPKTIEFYSQVLGMREVTFGDGRKALHFGSQKLNLHPADRVLDPNVKHATPGSADLCFLVAGSLEDWMKVLSDRGIPIVLGPVLRTGASGPIRSIYIYDPDENLLELATPDGELTRP
jgi:catechol 2,3-dioxygenase-like lactoylglutathione lyase family enzyme